MKNGEDAARHYADGFQAAMGERVTNLGRRVGDMEVEMRSGFNQIEQTIATFTNETRASIQALSTNIAERSRPQWQALSVLLGVLVVLGGLVYWPIRESTADLKAAVQIITEKMITREELDSRSEWGKEDRARTDAAIADLRAGIVTRNEWSERNLARDHDIANLQESIVREATNLQRQIDELRNALGNTYSLRDYIQRLTDRIDMLEQRTLLPRQRYTPPS